MNVVRTDYELITFPTFPRQSSARVPNCPTRQSSARVPTIPTTIARHSTRVPTIPTM
jgi:hypothetical protein